MIARLVHRFLLLAAVLLIGTASVVSAARMATPVAPELAAWLDAGGSASDLCGTAADHRHDQACPFCRLLSDPPDMTPLPRVTRFRPASAPLTRADLRRGPEPVHPRLLPRAPPALA